MRANRTLNIVVAIAAVFTLVFAFVGCAGNGASSNASSSEESAGSASVEAASSVSTSANASASTSSSDASASGQSATAAAGQQGGDPGDVGDGVYVVKSFKLTESGEGGESVTSAVYTLDEHGNVTEAVVNSTQDSISDRKTTFKRDENGFLAESSDFGAFKCEYDDQGRLVKYSLPRGATFDHVLSYGNEGVLSSYSVSGGFQYLFEYDKDGRVETVSRTMGDSLPVMIKWETEGGVLQSGSIYDVIPIEVTCDKYGNPVKIAIDFEEVGTQTLEVEYAAVTDPSPAVRALRLNPTELLFASGWQMTSMFYR